MNFLRLLTYLPYARHAILPLGLMVLLSVCKVLYIFLNLLLMPAVFDRLFVSFDVWVLLKIIGLSLALLGFTLFLDVGIETIGAHLQHKLAMRIKVSMQEKAFRFPMSFFGQDNSSGELSKLIIRDTDQVTIGLKEMTMTLSNLIQVVLMAYGCSIVAPWYFKIYMVMILCYFVWNMIWKPIYFRLAEHYANLSTKSYGFLWGSLGAFREIKILGLEDKLMDEFSDLQNKQKHTLWFHDVVNFLMSLLNQPLSSLGYAIILYIVLLKVQAGEYSLGMMAAFTSVVYLLLTPIVNITISFSGIQMGMAGAKLLSIMKRQKPEKTGKSKFSTLSGDIEMKNINFSYVPERPILKDVSVTFPKGKHVGIVGHTGCGKSTLLSLLLKLHQKFDGEIHLGDTKIAEFENDSLRENISYLGQDSLCFLGSIRANVDVKNELTDAEVDKICRSVEMGSILDRLGGINAEVTDTSLSGGERQRLFLARVIARNAEVFLFDEATSALDAKTERLILETLKEIRKGKTCVTVAHRVSNVKDCDTIYVMSDGEMVESGAYQELMDKKGHFWNLFMSSE